MKVNLIYLPKPFLNEPNAQAPLGLLYLAAMLEEEGISVSLSNLAHCSTWGAITQIEEADLYGITVTSMEVPQANRFASLIKERFPNSKIIIGGPGTVSAECIDDSFIDSICFGEAETTIVEIVRDAERGDLRPVYNCGLLCDLDSLPLPSRHLLGNNQGGKIFAFGKSYKGTASTVLLTSRGCPCKCSFCASPTLWPKVRMRSADNVIEEAKHIVSMGIHQIRISDDMFLCNLPRAKAICAGFKELGILWRISTRVKPFTPEIASMLFSSGCREVSFGIESFDDEVLRVLQKGTTAKDNIQACIIAKDAGLTIRGLMMIRTPGQTECTVGRNILGIEATPMDIVACSTFVPLPGSEIWNNPSKFGIEILSRNLEDYNFYFFGKGGKENELKSVIRPLYRTLAEFNKETLEFRDYLKSTGKVNKG